MQTKLHISTFIGLTISIWFLILWVRGELSLTIALFAPFSIVVGIMTFVNFIFVNYAWSSKYLQGWFVERPNLIGTWKVKIKSNYINKKTGKVISPVIGYAVIKQTLTSLTMRFMTKEGSSDLIAYDLIKKEDGLFRLAAVYRNEPKIELQDTRSKIHHGTFLLNIHDTPVSSLEGHYWTDRNTKGSVEFMECQEELCSTYQQAHRNFKK